jgi:hypothetical protein
MSHLIQFTDKILANHNLIIEMIKYTNLVINSNIGIKIYNDDSNEYYTNDEAIYVIHRIVLSEFGFKTGDNDVKTYHKIFKNLCLN